MAKETRITNRTTALDYLNTDAETRYPQGFEINGDTIVYSRVCYRCNGKGHMGGGIGPYAWQTCFKCGGNPITTIREDLVKFARKVKTREAAAVRKLSKANAIALEKAAHKAAAAEAFDMGYPGTRAALAPYTPVYVDDYTGHVAPKEHRILNDMACKLAQWGSLSEAQVALVTKLVAQENAPKAVLETGKRTLTGEVVQMDLYDNDYGQTWKMTLKLAGEDCRVFGSIPRAVLDWCIAQNDTSDDNQPFEQHLVGRTVTLTATVQRSDKNTDFGFYKRPSKATVEAA